MRAFITTSILVLAVAVSGMALSAQTADDAKVFSGPIDVKASSLHVVGELFVSIPKDAKTVTVRLEAGRHAAAPVSVKVGKTETTFVMSVKGEAADGTVKVVDVQGLILLGRDGTPQVVFPSIVGKRSPHLPLKRVMPTRK